MRAVVGRKDGKVMKYGYIKKDGSPLTECIFDEAQNFQYGMARIKQNGKYGLIDWNGSPLTPVVTIISPNTVPMVTLVPAVMALRSLLTVMVILGLR